MILAYPNEILRKKSEPVSVDDIRDGKLNHLVETMKKEVEKEKGAGLAAVQIGVLKRIILVEIDGIYHPFFNPQILKKSWRKILFEEGCLSVPGKSGLVKRYKGAVVTAFDERGNKIKIKARDTLAVVFQHEIDHLNGILFIDKIDKN